MTLFQAASYFLLPDLRLQCANYAAKEMNVDNVFLFLEAAVQYDEKTLYEKAKTLLDASPTKAISSASFLSIL